MISRTSRGAFVTRNEMSSGSSWDSHTGHHGHCAHSGTTIGRSIGARRGRVELPEAGSGVTPGWLVGWSTGASAPDVESCLVAVRLPRTESLEALCVMACLATLTRKLCSWS